MPKRTKNKPKGKLHEHGFNYALAGALRDSKAAWREKRSCVVCERSGAADRSMRPDILIEDPQISPVVIECAYGGDKDQDAAARLDQGICDTAIAVSVPPKFQSFDEDEARQKLRDGECVSYALLQREEGKRFRFPESGYVKGTVRDLAAMIPAASAPKPAIERVADKVAELIDESAAALSEELSDFDTDDIVCKVHQKTPLTAFRTVCVLWLDAMLFQSHLRRQAGDAVDELPTGGIMPSALAKSWRKILEHNWHSIFAPAVEVLERVGRKARSAAAAVLDRLAEAVEIIETARLGDHVSIGGELFPKISADRKEAAAFYTTPATAELLTALLIRKTDEHDWKDGDLFRSIRIADLACGTGTLVRAAFRRVRAFHEAEGGGSRTLSALHVGAMEDGIKAADVSPIAAHLTNSSMALVGAGDAYGKTNIGWVGVGEPAGKYLTTGSLEYLKESSMDDLFAKIGGGTGGTEDANVPIVVADGTLDYVVMNPPYSRTRGGQSAFDIADLSDEQRKLCQHRWGDLLKNEHAVKTAGMAASFLCLAWKKVKPGGRIGFVLPLTAAFAETWTVTREMIVKEFEEIVAVARAGGVGGPQALSADTSMGEMLLMATRRRRKTNRPRRVHCVTLRRMPVRQGEAGEFGRSIQNTLDAMRSDGHPVMAGNEELGQIARLVPRGGEPWAHLGVLHAALAIAAKRIADEGVLPDIAECGKDMKFSIPMTVIKNLFTVGPTHHLIGHPRGGDGCGAFVFIPITRRADAKYGVRSLWSAEASLQRQLIVEPTHKGIEWSGHAQKLLRKQGTLHYARGIRWTSQALLAASTQNKVFGGSAWTTLLYENKRMRKAFALWANSTLGLIAHWTRAGRTQMGRGRTQVRAIHEIPCPDLSRLDGAVLALAAKNFDALKADLLKPACQAHDDPVRAKIDDAVAAMLGLPKRRAKKSIGALRELWCVEPTIHGDNKTALELLKDKGLI